MSDAGSWRTTRRRCAVLARRIITVLVFLAFLVLLPIVIVLAPFVLVYRFVMVLLVRQREGANVMIMSADDIIWQQDCDRNRAIINCLLLFDGSPDISRMRRLISERLVEAVDPNNNRVALFPKFTRYAARSLNVFVWREEDRFDIDEHVLLHETALPAAQEERERLVGEICSQPLPARRAGWQAVFIAGDESEPADGRKFYMLFRVHHSLADGIALTSMMIDNLVDSCAGGCTLPARFGGSSRAPGVTNALLLGPMLLASRLTMARDSHALHGPPLTGVKHTAWSRPVSLAAVRRITRLTGTTINDVLVCCLASAFGEYFTARGLRPPAAGLRAYLPVDTRPKAVKRVTMVNHFSLVFLLLPLGHDDILETLRVTKRRMDEMKASPEPIVNAVAITYSMTVLPYRLSKLFFDWLSSKCSMVLSNVPGPQQKLAMGGHPLEGVIFWPPQKNDIGLGVSMFSYNGQVRVGVSADSGLMDSPRFVVDAFLEKVHHLAERLDVDM